MAECKEEKLTTEKITDLAELTNNINKNDSEILTPVDKEDTVLSNDTKYVEKMDENSVENCAGLSRISTQNGCSSSEESSPVKTGFLRSFMEKKQLVSQCSEGSENSQDKTE